MCRRVHDPDPYDIEEDRLARRMGIRWQPGQDLWYNEDDNEENDDDEQDDS